MAYVISDGQVAALNNARPLIPSRVQLSATFTADYATL